MMEQTFASGCSVNRCNAACCQDGVMVDAHHRDVILGHASIIQEQMEEGQEQDPEAWFGKREVKDSDYPSGRAVSTRATQRGCVFLDSKGLCVLQRAGEADGMGPFSLKPFFCVAFPITIDEGVVKTDIPEFTERPECCSVVTDGSMSVFDVCEFELRFVLGDEGYKELLSIPRSHP